MSDKKEKVIKYNKYQQGDVVMFQVDDEVFNKVVGKEYTGLDENENVIHYAGNTDTHAILAFGEATGHKHQINMADMTKNAGVSLHMNRFRTAGEDVPDGFIVRNETVTLKHEEHNAIDIPPGKYIVRIVREFDHIAGRARYVAD